MRLDRENFAIRFLGWIGWPLFWIVYGLTTFVAFGLNAIRLPWKRASLVFRVGVKVWARMVHRRGLPPKQRLSRLPVLKWILPSLLLCSLFAFSFYLLVLKGLPGPEQLISRDQQVTTKIYDRNGLLLYKIYKNQNRSIVALKDIPPRVIQATLAIEDAQFYQHPGFSIKGIVRAFTRNARGTSMQGGSTITQQLVKNTLLSSEKTLTRKIKELVLALEVEYYFTKDEILSMYFNEVPYGGTAYGIEEAAQQYFGKSVTEVSLAEASLLAGLPASPTSYSPFGSAPELAISRQHSVLQRMVEEQMITADEAEQAKTEPLAFVKPKTDIIAPHFVMYVKEALVNTYGENMVSAGGLEVTTTLDSRIQTIAQAAVSKELERLKNLHVTNGAALVIQPKTGEILAMVGSTNYFDTEHDGQVNVTLRPRQPGSSIKPLTYAYALKEKILTPGTLIDDAPVVYRTPGSPPYAPQNYDGKFHGKVTVRQALANSYNIPAVKTLSQIGVSNLVEFAKTMGITTWEDSSRFGLSLTLGSGEVRMIDMAALYGVFANGGFLEIPNPLIRVSDFYGTRSDEYGCNTNGRSCGRNRVLDPGVAYLLSDILSDNQARSAAFGTHSVLVIPNQQVAVKTGTTNDMRDNWTFGYTADYLVATWVGNNDNTPMSRVASGITGASPIWQTIMLELYKDKPKVSFSPPADVVTVAICPLTQTLACSACPNPRYDHYLIGTEPKQACTDEQITRETLPSPSPSPLGVRDQLLEGITIDQPKDRGKNRQRR